MNPFRQRLQQLLAQGPSAKCEIDRMLCADDADPREDLRTTLDRTGLDQLLLLQQKFRDGRVVERCYCQPGGDGQTEGCLLYWLMGITSNNDLLARRFPSEEIFMAVVRTIRFWDYGRLTRQTVTETLQAAIDERRARRSLKWTDQDDSAATADDAVCEETCMAAV